jgi:hypothetical protein
MLTRVTHAEDGYDLWIDLDEIIVMERYTRKKSSILTLADDRPEVTGLVLKGGKTLSCKETPDELMALKNKS